MLDQLNFKFSVIGLSEIKLKVDQSFLTNIEVPGYDFISQASLSNSGGVGFYVRNDLKFVVRDDLCVSREEFECLWIEIDALSQPNVLCSIIYRHPKASLENFTQYTYTLA
jgi:exonuclease III